MHKYPQQPMVNQVLLITAANCEAVTGLRWRVVRNHAKQLGVPVYSVGKKLAIPVEKLMAALDAASLVEPAEVDIESLSEDAQIVYMAAKLGLRRKKT